MKHTLKEINRNEITQKIWGGKQMKKRIRLVSVGLAVVLAIALCVPGGVVRAEGTEILRPNAAGDETLISYVYPAENDHWESVDSDSDADYVEELCLPFGGYKRDLYNIPSMSCSGSISKITVYNRARCSQESGDYASLKIAIKTGGEVYEDAAKTMTWWYTDYSREWATNPNTGLPWTTEDISSLQIGTAIRAPTADNPGGEWTGVSEVYVVVTCTVPRTGWVLPTGANDPDGKWDNEYYAYDGNLTTRANDVGSWPIGWHSFIELTLTDAIICNKVRLAVYRVFNDIDLFDIDVWDTEEEVWVHVFQGDLANSPTWNEKTFPVKSVSKARYRHYGDVANAWGKLFEFNFWVEEAIISPPYINLDVVSVDSDNNGFLDDTDEAAMIAAESEYVRRFDIDFDDDVDEADNTWFNNTRANNPSLGTIRDAIRTSTYQKLTWPDEFEAYIVRLSADEDDIHAFVGEDTTPVYGWIHVHKHPTIGESPKYQCHSFAIDTSIAAYKALGYGCFFFAYSLAGHSYIIFWIGGDWTDLNNWRILKPNTGEIISATGEGSPVYASCAICVWDYTQIVAGQKYIHYHKLAVDWELETVTYDDYTQDGWAFYENGGAFEFEEMVDVPYTFDTALGITE